MAINTAKAERTLCLLLYLTINASTCLPQGHHHNNFFQSPADLRINLPATTTSLFHALNSNLANKRFPSPGLLLGTNCLLNSR